MESIWEVDAVHPRLRGELISLSDADLDFVGSSPLTRGTPPQSNLSAFGVLVHPRLRGELITKHSIVLCSTGSSPLTRGTRLAGTRMSNELAVHPRLRGELF